MELHGSLGCCATNLGVWMRRTNEGAAMIRFKGEAGAGDVSNPSGPMPDPHRDRPSSAALSEDEPCAPNPTTSPNAAGKEKQ